MSQTIFDGRRRVPWYVSGWFWKAMVNNWAFYEDMRLERLRGYHEWERSLYAAAGRWTHPIVSDQTDWNESTEPVLEGFALLAGLA